MSTRCTGSTATISPRPRSNPWRARCVMHWKSTHANRMPSRRPRARSNAMTTVIVDYESGNLHSAEKAFQRMAAEADAGQVIVTSDPETVRTATRVVLPGDGAFPACRNELYDHRGLFEAIEETVSTQGRPFMGICIGMQMLATRGLEYRETDGFDWIGGTVDRIAPSDA